MKYIVVLLLLIPTLLLAQETNNAGTKEDREALFDYIIEKTKIREAWSPIKNEKLNFDPLADMLALKEEFINADTDEKLFYAIQKISAARRDKHLGVRPVDDGLVLPEINRGTAPVRFFPDFSDKNKPFLFVSDLGKTIGEHAKRTPKIGDQLISVNGEAIADYLKRVRQYSRYSTNENFIIRAGYDLTRKNNNLPPSFFKEDLTLTLKPKRGRTYTLILPYLEDVSWQYGRVFDTYAGYEQVTDFEYESFKLYKPTNAGNKTLVLWWYGFRGDLPEATDALIAWAEKNNALDYDLIIDAIDSRGGSQGAYALARLSPKPFKTTGGNLKLSDITYQFVSGYTNRYLSRKALMDHDSRETEDDGTWVIEWLNGPVLKGLAANQAYSNNTPFKCAHLPYYSDWIMQPAEKHFTGNMVVFFGPWGGSHLTQFAAMIHDNNLGHTMGMPDGGYSNTWEWTEVLKFPTTGKPVTSFMWDMGHTIRPNGQIAEGNPAMVDEYIPVTCDNYLEYKAQLLQKAEAHLKKKPN
ncbi:hypothetical protein [Flagellimonas sp. CMM7]|uniref:hypothetical protein n=1 Tax=Flagellimonas sp. CMM7 TaxID=2654676 RepID=UPI0013D3AD75|nr:hypothetical protein [Flagellimonas sp. CMM7]UII80350.1 hypothetical protein LV704_02275 [Flagellimonas sp. CMM7]